MNHRRSAWVQTSMLLCCATACGPSSAPEELFIGHSFFKPFAENMGPLNMQAGRDDIDAEVVFSGGASGSPQALWEDRKQRREIQGYLDGGNVDLFVMTYEPIPPMRATSSGSTMPWKTIQTRHSSRTSWLISREGTTTASIRGHVAPGA